MFLFKIIFYSIDASSHYFWISVYVKVYSILSSLKFILLKYIDGSKKIETVISKKNINKIKKKLKKIVSL